MPKLCRNHAENAEIMPKLWKINMVLSGCGMFDQDELSKKTGSSEACIGDVRDTLKMDSRRSLIALERICIIHRFFLYFCSQFF